MLVQIKLYRLRILFNSSTSCFVLCISPSLIFSQSFPACKCIQSSLYVCLYTSLHSPHSVFCHFTIFFKCHRSWCFNSSWFFIAPSLAVVVVVVVISLSAINCNNNNYVIILNGPCSRATNKVLHVAIEERQQQQRQQLKQFVIRKQVADAVAVAFEVERLEREWY